MKIFVSSVVHTCETRNLLLLQDKTKKLTTFNFSEGILKFKMYILLIILPYKLLNCNEIRNFEEKKTYYISSILTRHLS